MAITIKVEKCKELHVGSTNPCRKHKMLNRDLKDVDEEKDLGVLVDSALKFHKQTTAAVKIANSRLGLIRKSFPSLDERTFPLLFKSLVRLKLEYINLIWSPGAKDIIPVERVRGGVTKMIPKLLHLDYVDRLRPVSYTHLRAHET